MRLVTGLKRLEAAARKRKAKPRAGLGVVWSSRDVRVEDAALCEGELVACDLHFEVGPGAWPDGVDVRITSERVTLDPSDLGIVTGPDGVRLGEVVSIDGDVIRWATDAELGIERSEGGAGGAG